MTDKLNPDDNINLNEGEDQEAENMVLNLDDVDEDKPAFEPLPAGAYNCVVENAEYGVSQRSQNPMITWVFKVVDPQYENRLLFYHTVLNSQQGLARLKRLLTRVVPDIDMSSFNPKKFCEEGEALGFPCQVKVRIRTYRGERRNDVTDVLPPSEGGASYLEDELE